MVKMNLYDAADDLSRLDEEGHGWPKQLSRELEAHFVPVENRDVVCSCRYSSTGPARRFELALGWCTAL